MSAEHSGSLHRCLEDSSTRVMRMVKVWLVRCQMGPRVLLATGVEAICVICWQILWVHSVHVLIIYVGQEYIAEGK